MAMFTSTVRERDPAEQDLMPNESLIRSSLEDSPSLENISSRVPINNMNRQISNIDSSLQSLTYEMKSLTNQMRSVLEYTSHLSINSDSRSQVNGRARSVDKALSQVVQISSVVRPRSHTPSGRD